MRHVALDVPRLLTGEEPTNPVFPMALALGVPGAFTNRALNEWYRRVSELTPDSVWGHYARGATFHTDPSFGVIQLCCRADKASSMPEPYESLLLLEERSLKDVDVGIGVAEQMATQPAFASRALLWLWRLRFNKANQSDEARKDLRAVLEKASATSDISVLNAVRQTYGSVPNDQVAAEIESPPAFEGSIRCGIPSGIVKLLFAPANLSGVGRFDPLTGRSFELVLGRVRSLDDVTDPAERLVQLQEALKRSPTAVATRFIRERIFAAAEEAHNTKALVADGAILLRVDPGDAAVPARMALALAADTPGSREALRYAEAARKLTAEWHPIDRPANTDAELFAERFPESRQRGIFNRQRAIALDAHGLILCQLGDCTRAEPLLRESVSLDRSERNLSHLADALTKLNRTDEASTVAHEAAVEFAASVRRKFISEPATDFRLQAINGETITLQSLKGKMVILSFWATWCVPCKSEMPKLADFYRRVSGRGLEILAVTPETPNERRQIDDFVQKYRLPFPVLYANGLDGSIVSMAIPPRSPSIVRATFVTVTLVSTATRRCGRWTWLRTSC